MLLRLLERDEVGLVWTIDRAELIERIYRSATPTEGTVQFYLRQGCVVLEQPDPGLFALEPEDIHLECASDCRG
jgi:hypothetical protein